MPQQKKTLKQNESRNMKKKMICMALTVVMAVSLSSCGQSNQTPNTTAADTATVNAINEAQAVTTAVAATQASMEETTTTNYIDSFDAASKNYAISAIDNDVPCLYDFWKDYFKIGIAVTKNEIENDIKNEVIKKEFNSITCGNEMKADFLLDHKATLAQGDDVTPVLNFDQADPILKFAEDNGIQMRGHTLCWYSQVPDWFFKAGWSDDKDAVNVTRDVMLKRLENYIKEVMDYCNTNYPGVIYCWDVANEAIEPADGNELGLRKCLWYDTVGNDFVERAFEYARKYAAPDQKLFYNDYNCYDTNKRGYIIDLVKRIQAEGNIDGVGMQSHISMTYPTLDQYEDTILKFSRLGLEVQITELDVSLDSNTDEAFLEEGTRFKQIFYMLKNLEDTGKADITAVTVWGLDDADSWLLKDGERYPLLFTKMLETKPAFWGMLLESSVPLY